MSVADFETLRRHFADSACPVLHADCPGHRAAAVLLLVCPGERELEIVLTRRSGHLPHHAGQISLPGGSRDPEDESLVHTALREAWEEIGLDAGAVDVLGCLPAAHLPSGFCVTPVVALSEHPPALRPDPAEVEEIFSLPLSLVLDRDLYRRGSRLRNGINRKFYYFDFEGYYIWGATAGILHSLAHAMGQGYEEAGLERSQ